VIEHEWQVYVTRMWHARGSGGRGSPVILPGRSQEEIACSQAIALAAVTSGRSSEPSLLTFGDWSTYGLTCEALSRRFSSLPAESRTHVPAMCPVSPAMTLCLQSMPKCPALSVARKFF